MGAGAVQTLEGLVQNRNDPPLFLQRREWDYLPHNSHCLNVPMSDERIVLSPRFFISLEYNSRINNFGSVKNVFVFVF